MTKGKNGGKDSYLKIEWDDGKPKSFKDGVISIGDDSFNVRFDQNGKRVMY